MNVTKMDKIKIGVIAFGAIIVIILITGAIRYWSFKPPDLYKELVAQKDSTISAIKSERTTLLLLLDERNQRIYEHERNDSLAAIQYQKGQQVHNSLNDKLPKISQHLQSIANNNDSLRSELARYD